MLQIHRLSQFSASKVLSFGEDLGEVSLKVAILFLSRTHVDINAGWLYYAQLTIHYAQINRAAWNHPTALRFLNFYFLLLQHDCYR
jgi:hypothetical protein